VRVGFVVSFLELTGGHIAVVEIANRLADRGHEVSLVYPARSILSRRNDVLRVAERIAPDRLLAPLFRTNGSDLDWMPFRGDVVRAPELEERHMPELDVVVATAWQTAERVATFGTRTGTKIYFIQHYETWSGPERRVDATWRAPFVRIVTSEWLRRLARERFGIEDVAVVPYGVDVDRFRPVPTPPRERPRIGLLSHDEPWKGLADSLEALRDVSGRRDFELVLFGLAPPPGGLPAGAQFVRRPRRDELPALYSSFDVFLCGSWSESGPMTVAEAMACGTCVVSTDVGNVSLWSRDGEGAFLAPPRDPRALADALEAALADPGECARRASRGRELIQAFTWERTAEEFARVVEARA
jgi:glycosyltransferase involved in cell wall biosynthesis